jgi:GNAT superfamily N-acetyltransferase
MQIRDYEPSDAAAIVALFTATVHAINARDYSLEQLNVWAPRDYDLARWAARLAEKRPFVAVQGAIMLGFCELEADGHIDCFYVNKDYQGQGVGQRLYGECERRALASGCVRLYAEVSLTARPFFTRQGFRLIATQEVVRQGVRLTNFRMEKLLA